MSLHLHADYRMHLGQKQPPYHALIPYLNCTYCQLPCMCPSKFAMLLHVTDSSIAAVAKTVGRKAAARVCLKGPPQGGAQNQAPPAQYLQVPIGVQEGLNLPQEQLHHPLYPALE